MRIHKHAQVLNVFRGGIDLLCVTLCWILAYTIRFKTELIELTKGTDTFSRYASLLPALILSYGMVFVALGVYRRSLERRRVWEEAFDLSRAHLMSFVVFVASVYFVYDHRFSRATMGVFFVLAPIALAFGRSFLRKLNRWYLRHSKTRGRAVVVGSGAVAERMVKMIQDRSDWALVVDAQLDISHLPDLRARLNAGDVDIVFLAPSASETPRLHTIYEVLGNTLADVIVVPDFEAPEFLVPRIIQLDALPAIVLNGSSLDSYGRILKRGFDLVFSAFALLLLSPVFAACALAVRISSPGPIFYKQERMGLDGKTFNCLKFRGMRVDAESSSGPVWASKNDSRVTRVGAFLRKTSLDEIPQFWNVLRGEMSVVGPRPERPFFVDQFRHNLPGYMLRHKVKAGITGWAQINGWRGNTSLEKRIECDLWYIQNWSLWLDLKICVLTPLKGFIHPNAY
ncbi:MAG: undecaprenyl-phosphate glucose phosphotransferase [Betaproteobacteria bacterium]|nr:undecaprenyl-phosphate glucose phosphotransferase [Betaproteobacteria bacterium]